MNAKWNRALALVPFLLAGCTDQIEPDQTPGTATSGDEVQFAVAKASSGIETRTMYQDNWEEATSQAIYWGNYTDEKEKITIYCSKTNNQSAQYNVNFQKENPESVAESVVKIGDIGLQWGQKGEYTFYAFYPADKAGTTLTNGNTITATVEAGQSPRMYKYKMNSTEYSTLQVIENMGTYNENEKNKVGKAAEAKTIYGMPDMRAAIMVARKTMPEEDFGKEVPLQFNVLADVLDITLNGPIRPNTLGGNANDQGEGGIESDFIQIQAITIDVVIPKDDLEPEDYPIDQSVRISGSFNLNMAESVAETKDMVTNIDGTSTVQLQTAQIVNNNTYYPTLYVRSTNDNETNINLKELDHLRLRAFLIPGQITGQTLNKLRVHLQTNCGDFYQMLNNDDKFATGKLYPVKFGYFKKRGEDFDLTKWIGQLNPNIYLSELSVPGAWHAANTTYQGNVDMKSLYNAGIRAFEVHTKNGADILKYGNFDEKFDINQETEDFPNPFPIPDGEHTSVTNLNIISTGSTDNNSITIDGTTYNRRRTVTATATVRKIVYKNAHYIVPKFWLRLYRTVNNSMGNNSLSDAIMDLASKMNPDGLMFLEIGMNDQTAIQAPYRRIEGIQVYEVENVNISGYEGGTWKLGNWNPTWSGKYSWDLTSVQYPDPTIGDNTPGTFTLDGAYAWSIAVNSCLERLRNETNKNTRKSYLFTGNLTANTTIGDAQGHVIVKINTNVDSNAANETPYFWNNDCPALFSRWISGSGKTPQTINLKWNSPVPPFDGGDTGVPNTDLRWCFTELDNIVNMSDRKAAIEKMNDVASTNYAGGLHRTFYETSLGGFANPTDIQNPTVTKDMCLDVAKELNPFALSRIANPTRQAVPLGLVFMDYCIPPTGQEDTYKSAELIRAIINNNKAFLLHRKNESAAPDVEEKTNSHFNNNSQNPLK